MSLVGTELYAKFESYIDGTLKPAYLHQARLARLNRVVFLIFNVLAVLPVFTSSAIAMFDQHDTLGRWLLVVLPLVGGAAGAILLRFRLGDIWRLRERARVEMKVVYENARLKLATADTQQSLENAYADTVRIANDLDKSLSNRLVETTSKMTRRFESIITRRTDNNGDVEKSSR